ncbi:MAG: DUF3021 domain-containing protein [Acetanaerobacterium sp.]
MRMKIIRRALLGFPLGVFIGYTIAIIISLVIGAGDFYPSVPSFAEQCGSEIGAVVLQFVLCGILGAASAAGSAVWENDSWSLIKQSLIHFLILSFTLLPIAYFTHWMDHSPLGILSYFGIFLGLYVVIWAVQYRIWKRRIRQVNDKIKETNR